MLIIYSKPKKSIIKYIYSIFPKLNKTKLYFFHYCQKFFAIFNCIWLLILHKTNIKASKKKKPKKNNKKRIKKL